jgi:hypothetical protein
MKVRSGFYTIIPDPTFAIKFRIHMRQRLDNTVLCHSGAKILHNITVVRASTDSPHQIFHDGELLCVAGGVLQLRLLQIFGRLLRPTNQSITQSIQCCGSGSGIRCLFDPWIRVPGWVESQHPDPG